MKAKKLTRCTTCKKTIKHGEMAVYLQLFPIKKTWFCMKCAKMKKPPEMMSII